MLQQPRTVSGRTQRIEGEKLHTPGLQQHMLYMSLQFILSVLAKVFYFTDVIIWKHSCNLRQGKYCLYNLKEVRLFADAGKKFPCDGENLLYVGKSPIS